MLSQNAEPGGLWHQPALLNLLADLLTVLAVAALAWSALAALQRLPVFPLRELILTQMPRQVPLDQIEHAARGAVVGNFFTVDLDATRSVFEKLPWVRKATLRRQWPDGLMLAIEEHEAIARWHRPGGASDDNSLVNSHGEVFVAELPADAPPLPRLSGPEGSAPELLRRRNDFDTMLAGIDRHVATITLSPRLAWRLKLDDGIALELGRDQDNHPLAERLERFVASYSTVKERVGTVSVADMRYPNGFALSGNVHAVLAAPGKKQERRT